MAYWLNKPVFGHGIWPSKEVEVEIDGYKFVLCPLTKDKQASIHVDLDSQRLSSEKAIAIINVFASHLCWVSGQAMWIGDGFSGGHLKSANFDREQGMSFELLFFDFPDNFEFLDDRVALKALSFYRQAKVAQQYSLAYACLSFYKILEIEKKTKGKDALNDWINDQLPEVRKHNDFLLPTLERLASQRGDSLSEFIFRGIRNEAAHFLEDSDVNLDESAGRELFGYAARPLEDLATRYIRDRLGVSDSLFSIAYATNSPYAWEKRQERTGQDS